MGIFPEVDSPALLDMLFPGNGSNYGMRLNWQFTNPTSIGNQMNPSLKTASYGAHMQTPALRAVPQAPACGQQLLAANLASLLGCRL
eukprot:185700-Pelagomonas_calceolata.AAC.1